MSSGITSAPRAMVAISPLSRAPKTRPITASGVRRCRIVEALMSTTGLAAPMIAIARKAAQAVGHTAISSRGSAQNTTPHPKSEASRCRAARPMARKPPKMAPTPSTESSQPSPDGPRSVMSKAMATAKTHRRAGDDRLRAVRRHHQPQVGVAPDHPEALEGVEEEVRLLLFGGRLDRLRVGADGLARRGDRHGAAVVGGRMPQTMTADRTKVSALTAKTAATSATASRNPASAGPTKNARLSTVLETPLAAVSSSGVFTSDGVSASCAGRKAVPTIGERVASTKTTAAGPRPAR